MSNPPDILVEGVNLDVFERLVYTRDGSPQVCEQIALELFGILGKIRRGSGFLDLNEDILNRSYTRLAGAITAVFSDPKFVISWEGFVRLAGEHAQLHAIFRVSAFDTMDHIIGTFGTRDPATPQNMTFTGEQAIVKMLLCWALDSEIDVDFEAVAKAAPNHAAAAMLGMLGVGGSHTPKSYGRRLMLMRMRALIEAVPMPEPLIQSAGDCYMHCSYTDAPDKHEIKRLVNNKMKEVVAPLKIEEVSRALVRKDRPTIVIPLEWFGSYHAMFRCYAPSMRQLRARFRMVAVLRHSAEQPSIDDKAKEVFDKVIELTEANASISTFVEAIKLEKPDILYYPSIGMAAWFVALSNFRLAPIQLMTPGHPATSMSDKIDYIMCETDLLGDEKNYVEKCVHLPVGSVRYVDRAPVDLPKERGSKDGTVRFAIAAMATKIIPPFLEALQEIRKRSPRPVEFHFFPNQTGLSNTMIRKDLRRWLPDVTVHPRAHYAVYLEWLAKCDAMLSTFPFGGTNSVIDSFLLGLPVVTWEGDQIHSRSDASMIRRVGLPDWLIAHSSQEYVESALRCCAGELPKPTKDIAAEFFGAAPIGLEGKFLEAMEKLYEECLDDQERGFPEGAGAPTGVRPGEDQAGSRVARLGAVG